MKDETKELFLQSYNVILSRRISYYHEQYKDCDPQKAKDVKRRIKMEMYGKFYECTNDKHICAISKFLQFFNDQVDQFQSRSYDEHIDNAKNAFEIYYSCRERDFKDGSGEILVWSNKRISCELGKYKAELDFYEMQIEPPSLNYDDEGDDLNDEYTLIPSITPLVNDTSLFDEMEQEIAKEISKQKEAKQQQDKQVVAIKKDFTLKENYIFLVKLYERLIDGKRISKIDIYDFLALIYDEPTTLKLNYKGSKEELAYLIIELDSKLTLTPSFKGRANSIKYGKWIQIFMHWEKDIKENTLKQAIRKVVKKMPQNKNDISSYSEIKNIRQIINFADLNIPVAK